VLIKSTHLKFTTTWSTKQLKLFFYRSYSHYVTRIRNNKKSSGYAKKRKLSGNQFQNMAKKLRINSDQGETSEANISASARKISARISTESIKESVWLSFSQYGNFKRHIRASTLFKLSKI
jgi:hypothetical protein